MVMVSIHYFVQKLSEALTEQNTNLLKLKKSEEQYRLVSENINDIV